MCQSPTIYTCKKEFVLEDQYTRAKRNACWKYTHILQVGGRRTVIYTCKRNACKKECVLEGLLRYIKAQSSEPQPPDDLLDVVLSLASTDGGLGVVWSCLWSAGVDWAPRMAAFAAARVAETVGEAIWPVVSTCLSSPTATDPSTLVNTASAIQLADSTTPLARAVLQVDAFGFIVRCLAQESFVANAAADMVLGLHDQETLSRILTRQQARAVTEQLSSVSLSPTRAKALAECLQVQNFSTSLPFDRSPLTKAIAAPPRDSGKSAWAKATSAAEASAKDVLNDILVSQCVLEGET